MATPASADSLKSLVVQKRFPDCRTGRDLLPGQDFVQVCCLHMIDDDTKCTRPKRHKGPHIHLCGSCLVVQEKK